jgi:hypothetical protein
MAGGVPKWGGWWNHADVVIGYAEGDGDGVMWRGLDGTGGGWWVAKNGLKSWTTFLTDNVLTMFVGLFGVLAAVVSSTPLR